MPQAQSSAQAQPAGGVPPVGQLLGLPRGGGELRLVRVEVVVLKLPWCAHAVDARFGAAVPNRENSLGWPARMPRF